MTRNLKNIFYNFEEGNYGLTIVFDLDGLYLLFDSTNFIYTDAPESFWAYTEKFVIVYVRCFFKTIILLMHKELVTYPNRFDIPVALD